MKKTGYLLLLAVLILQSGGLFFVFNVKQWHVQSQMAEKLESGNATFEKLILTANEYQKSRVHAAEICLNGKMYDVKCVTVTGDAVELYAIHDLEEENIIEKIKNLVKNTCLPPGKVPPYLQQLVSLVYLPPFSNNLLIIPSTGKFIFHQLKLNIVSYDPGIASPPPRLA